LKAKLTEKKTLLSFAALKLSFHLKKPNLAAPIKLSSLR
jgi:hypothetical protein